MHAISLNDSSCKLWACTSVWYKKCSTGKKNVEVRLRNLCVDLGWSPWTRLSDKPAPIRREQGMIVLNPPLLSLCGYFFVFLTRRGWQHRRRGSRRFPRWVIFIALTHLSMSVYWFFHAPVSLCFPEKCLQKKKKKKKKWVQPLDARLRCL